MRLSDIHALGNKLFQAEARVEEMKRRSGRTENRMEYKVRFIRISHSRALFCQRSDLYVTHHTYFSRILSYYMATAYTSIIVSNAIAIVVQLYIIYMMHLSNNSEVYKKKYKKGEKRSMFYVHGALIALIMYAIFIKYALHALYVRKIIEWYVYFSTI